MYIMCYIIYLVCLARGLSAGSWEHDIHWDTVHICPTPLHSVTVHRSPWTVGGGFQNDLSIRLKRVVCEILTYCGDSSARSGLIFLVRSGLV